MAADHEDVDNINFANYKGIYAEEESDQKYTCPVTGAHFEFNDICRRLGKIQIARKRIEEQEKQKARQQHQASQQQSNNQQALKVQEVFSSSMVSISDEIATRNNFNSSHLKAGAGNLQKSGGGGNGHQRQAQNALPSQEQFVRSQNSNLQQAAPQPTNNNNQLTRQQQYALQQQQQQQQKQSASEQRIAKGGSGQVVRDQQRTNNMQLKQKNLLKAQSHQMSGDQMVGNSFQAAQGRSGRAPTNDHDSLEAESLQGHTVQQSSTVKQKARVQRGSNIIGDRGTSGRVEKQESSSVQGRGSLSNANQQFLSGKKSALSANQKGSQILQRNQTDSSASQMMQVVPPPDHHLNVKKNNFFTEPDQMPALHHQGNQGGGSGMMNGSSFSGDQQSQQRFLQHNRQYGLNVQQPSQQVEVPQQSQQQTLQQQSTTQTSQLHYENNNPAKQLNNANSNGVGGGSMYYHNAGAHSLDHPTAIQTNHSMFNVQNTQPKKSTNTSSSIANNPANNNNNLVGNNGGIISSSQAIQQARRDQIVADARMVNQKSLESLQGKVASMSQPASLDMYASNTVHSNRPIKKSSVKEQKSSGKSGSSGSGVNHHHHQRTVASHFATQDSRLGPTSSSSNNHFGNLQKQSAGQLSYHAAQHQAAYASVNHHNLGNGAGSSQTSTTVQSKTAQGKTRKSTSLKTGSHTFMSDQVAVAHQLALQQQQTHHTSNIKQPHQSQQFTADQYNQLMQQLMKSQSSVQGQVTSQQQTTTNAQHHQSSSGIQQSRKQAQPMHASVSLVSAVEKSSRTRTRSNAPLGGGGVVSGSASLTVVQNQTVAKQQGSTKGNEKVKTTKSSRVSGIANHRHHQGTLSQHQMQSQTFSGPESSAQYYTNVQIQSSSNSNSANHATNHLHSKQQNSNHPTINSQQSRHKMTTSSSKIPHAHPHSGASKAAREGSSVSVGNRKNSSQTGSGPTNNKASLSSYIRSSAGGKQLKQSAIGSRNQIGIGGHLNSQVSKGHRSLASGAIGGNHFGSMGGAEKHHHRGTGAGADQSSTTLNLQTQKSRGGNAGSGHGHNGGQSSSATHKIIDEVVMRLSQHNNNGQQPQNNGSVSMQHHQQSQQNQHHNTTSQNQSTAQASRNQKHLLVSHTTGGATGVANGGNQNNGTTGGQSASGAVGVGISQSNTVNKSNKQRTSGYFDSNSIQDIMSKYQRGSRVSNTNHQNHKLSSQANAKQYLTAQHGVSSSSGTTAASKAQLSAKKQARLNQYVNRGGQQQVTHHSNHLHLQQNHLNQQPQTHPSDTTATVNTKNNQQSTATNHLQSVKSRNLGGGVHALGSSKTISESLNQHSMLTIGGGNTNQSVLQQSQNQKQNQQQVNSIDIQAANIQASGATHQIATKQTTTKTTAKHKASGNNASSHQLQQMYHQHARPLTSNTYQSHLSHSQHQTGASSKGTVKSHVSGNFGGHAITSSMTGGVGGPSYSSAATGLSIHGASRQKMTSASGKTTGTTNRRKVTGSDNVTNTLGKNADKGPIKVPSTQRLLSMQGGVGGAQGQASSSGLTQKKSSKVSQASALQTKQQRQLVQQHQNQEQQDSVTTQQHHHQQLLLQQQQQQQQLQQSVSQSNHQSNNNQRQEQQQQEEQLAQEQLIAEYVQQVRQQNPATYQQAALLAHQKQQNQAAAQQQLMFAQHAQIQKDSQMVAMRQQQARR